MSAHAHARSKGLSTIISKISARLTKRFFLCALVAPMMLILCFPSMAERKLPPKIDPASNRSLDRFLIPGTQELQLIIQLSEPSVVESMRAAEGQTVAQQKNALSEPSRLNLQSHQSRAHKAKLGKSQSELIKQLDGMRGAKVQGTVNIVMNAVIARVPVDQYPGVQSLPGVKKVYFSRPLRMLLDTSAVLENAQGLWNKTGGRAEAGRGIKIGIMDTGIDITNPMFIDDSLTPPMDFPKGETDFTNNKVIVARNYIRFLAQAQEVRTAIDEVGHGSFVAGVAGGKEVTAPLATISGMAPGSFLGNYKVFGSPGINDSTTTAAIIAAIDDAVADGMDVLNISLGALDYVPPEDDPEIVAVENAISAGVVVAISAGNDGSEIYTIENPGAAPDAITVGAVSNSRTFGSTMHVTAPSPVPSNLSGMLYFSGDGPPISTKISSTPIVDVQTLDGNGYGCSAFPAGSLTGEIALIERGSPTTNLCYFSDKVNNAAAAKAAAVIVYNNVPSGPPIYMSGLSKTTIPAVMISNTDGLALKNFTATHPGNVQVGIDDSKSVQAVPTVSRVLSSFSSIGPAPNFSIKPDLVAVGENVYSAAQRLNPNGILYNPSGFTLADGTSFSSPMVAGAAAGLEQLFPELGPLAIKSLLTSTASRNFTVDGTNPPSVLQAGSGLLDMGSAAAAGVVFNPTNLSFGAHSYSNSLSLTQTLSIKNISSSTDQYALSIEPLVSGPTLTLSQKETSPMAPGATTSVDVSMLIDEPLSGGCQGFVVVRSSATSTTYRIPYLVGAGGGSGGSASITINSPNGTESWEVGSIHYIVWTTTGTVGNVKIEVSTNGGGTYTTIAAATGNMGGYSWTVPNTPSSTVKIRVGDVAGTVSDTSDENFTIDCAGCCYTISPSSRSFGTSGGTGSVSVTAGSGCAWTATSNASWITLTSGESGSDNGTVNYSVAGSDTSRTGTITIASQTFTVTQGPTTGVSTDLFVPIVLSSGGAGGSFYTTELTLTNRGTSTAQVEFTYTAALSTGSGTATTTLAPGQVVTSDSIAYLESLGIPIPDSGNRGGTVRVRFTNLSSGSAASVTARTTTLVKNSSGSSIGRAGLAYSAIPVDAALTGPAFICGLRQSAIDRSNVAFQNVGAAGGGSITLQVTVFDGNSSFSKVLPSIVLDPGGFTQIGGVLASNGLTLTNGYIKVERTSGTAPYYAYGVINDQVNSDGSFVAPQPAGTTLVAGLTLPVIVQTSTFLSELVLSNFSSQERTINFKFVADAITTADKTALFAINVPAGRQQIIPDIMAYLRSNSVAGIGEAGTTIAGALSATASGGDISGVVLGARTSAPGVNVGGRFGLFYTAVSYGQASTNGAWLFGLQQNSENRTNLAIVNTGETDASSDTFVIDLYDGATGTRVKSMDPIVVSPHGWVQIGTLLNNAPSIQQGYAQVRRTAGANPFITYGVINDGAGPEQRTGDGAFIRSSP